DIGRMQHETGADGVMVARGALGNPWIFSAKIPTNGEIRSTLHEHLEYHLSFYGRHERALMTFRKHIVWYTKGIPNSAGFRYQMFQEKTYDGVMSMLHRFFSEVDPNGRNN